MAEGRFLSRNIAFSEQIGAVSFEADYLFMRMLPHLDCEGRITGSAKSIKARCCPLRDEMIEPVILAALAELDQVGLIVWYDVDGVQCIEYPGFEKHQTGLRKDREQASRVPASSALGAKRVRTNSGATPELVRSNSATMREASGHSKGREVKGREEKSSGRAARATRGEPLSALLPTDWPSSPVGDLVSSYAESSGGASISAGRLGNALKANPPTLPWLEFLAAWQRWAKASERKFGPEWAITNITDFRPKVYTGDLTPEEMERLGA